MIFGDEWRGIYIRGDNAMWYISQLRSVLILEEDHISDHSKAVINEVLSMLSKSNHHTPDKVQMMKDFKECFIKDEGEPNNIS